MVIYIHGFGSSGEGSKAVIMRPFFQREGFIAPSLPVNPELAIKTLCELIQTIQRFDTITLVGSSLGGYYALYLANRYGIKCVLINPSIYPYKTLQQALGQGVNFYDNTTYEWNENHLELLKKFEITAYDSRKLLLLLQKGDELLDYREALEKLQGVQAIVEEGGSHSFDGVERHIDTLREFITL